MAFAGNYDLRLFIKMCPVNILEAWSIKRVIEAEYYIECVSRSCIHESPHSDFFEIFYSVSAQCSFRIHLL